MMKTVLSGMRVTTLILGILLAHAIFSAPAEALTLRLLDHASEDGGLVSNGGEVSIPESLSSDLVIRLSSSDSSQVSVPETVVIRAGETSALFDLTIVDDGEVNGRRRIVVTAAAADGTSTEGTLNIEDNDPGQIQFSASSYSANERDRGAVISVVRTSSSSGEIHVEYGTENGTASAGSDYESLSGTLTFHNGEVNKTFSIPILDDLAAEEDKTIELRLSHPTGGAVLGSPSTAILTIQDDDKPDFFTEIFEQNDNDIANQTLTFVPDGSKSFYAVCKTPAYSFSVDPSGGTILSLSDDSYAPVVLTGDARVLFFGVPYRTFTVGSNGYLTFASGDGSYRESLSHHFSQPRLSVLFDDLNPALGGRVSWKQLTDRVVVTFQEVPKNYSGKRNSFQIEMFFDGILRMTHLGRETGDGLIGLSRGGVPAEFAESNLSEYPACFFLSLPKSVTEGKETDVVAPGTLGALIPPPTALEIRMTSSDPSELEVDRTVLFPAGESSVLFDLTTMDDRRLDGTQTVTITATLPGGGSISGSVCVNDNESAVLTVEVPKTAKEGDGRLPGGGRVVASATVDRDVVVSLSSDDPTEVTVPERVTIPRGKNSASFDLDIENDVVVDGPRTATITASVSGWTSGSETMVILDDGEDGRFAPTLAAGDYHSVALDDHGRVWIWGDNGDAQLGDGSSTNRNEPEPVPGLEDVFAVAAGGNHTLALTGDGRVWAWGDNSSGQLGNGMFMAWARPAPVPHGVDAVAVAAGYSHSLALKKEGTVWAWGDNTSGQLGTGTTESSNFPVKVPELTGVIAIAAGRYHTLALKGDGTLWAWGSNSDGQLGDGSFHTRMTPVQVLGLSQGVSIAAGAYHSLAIQKDGKVWAWGRNWEGQLGEPSPDHRTIPSPVNGLSGAVLACAGTSHSLALKANGTVWAWGENDHGQLGDNTFQPSSTPVPVSDLGGVIGLAAGANHSVALRNDGAVWTWGDNGSGQLGDGTFGSQKTPVQAIGPSGVEPLDLISLSVTLPQRVTEADGVLVGKGAVILKEALKTDLEVTLTSSNPSEVSVPGRMIIPAGQTSASFDLTVREDSLLDGPQAVRVTAFALGYVPAGATMEVDDNESDILSMEVPSLVTESDGWLFLRGSVRLSVPPDKDITVYLNAEGTAQVIVPATVVIPAGETSALFSMQVLDDQEVEGPRETLITAGVPGWASETRRMEVEDDEPLDLFVGVEQDTGESGASPRRRGIVTILTPLSYDLVVDLFSDDPFEAPVPSFVIIPAGETMTVFDVPSAESREELSRQVTITAQAPGWSTGVVALGLDKSGTSRP